MSLAGQASGKILLVKPHGWALGLPHSFLIASTFVHLPRGRYLPRGPAVPKRAQPDIGLVVTFGRLIALMLTH